MKEIKVGRKCFFSCLVNRRKGVDFDGLGVSSPVLSKINPLDLGGKHKRNHRHKHIYIFSLSALLYNVSNSLSYFQQTNPEN